MKQNIVLALVALCCVACATLHASESSTVCPAGAVPEAFSGWPTGLDPKTVGGRVVDQFRSAEPESYQPKGFSAGPYGGGKYVPYAVASLWVNAMEYALLTSQRNLKIELCEKFDPFLPGRAKADKVTKPRHVDFNVFGAVPLEVAVLTGEKRAKAMGLRYADDQWEPPRPDDLACYPGWLKSHYVAQEKQLEYLKNGYSGQTRLWIDDMYMINVLQTQAYRVTTNRQYIVRAAHEMVLYLDKLQLENGLFNHAADVPFRWARGNGWMAAGMPMILQYLKPGDENYDCILDGYRRILDECGTLGAYVREAAGGDGYAAVRAICRRFGTGGAATVVPQGVQSACKRVCLFLRWMVRSGSPVDLGLWADFIDRRTLVMPLDTHVVQQSMRLGLLPSATASMSAARRLTAALSEVFPDDPLRGDFALFGYGVNHPKSLVSTVSA